MNKSIVTFLLLIGIIASSCTTSKSVVSQNANLSKYEYASIINNDTYHIPAQLMEHEIQLFDAIEESRLKLINHMPGHIYHPGIRCGCRHQGRNKKRCKTDCRNISQGMNYILAVIGMQELPHKR